MDLQSTLYQIGSVLRRTHYWNFYNIMEFERKLGVKSTFFFLNETYPFHLFKIPSWRYSLGYYNLFDPNLHPVIKELDDQGWEVGLHGSYFSYKDITLLKKEKFDLESILGHPVFGVRQHYLNLDQHTWERQAEAGFFYDASFGFTDNIGFKENQFHLFKPLSNQNFYVIPLALMDSCVMGKKNSFEQAINVIKIAEENKACLVLNWHQRVFNKKEFPGYMDMYLRLIEECKNRKAHFCTIIEYIRGIS
jgi:peptidoglycan/xylan/chitin deacetylase (PgdA/CDA1 family)